MKYKNCIDVDITNFVPLIKPNIDLFVKQFNNLYNLPLVISEWPFWFES